MPTYPKSPLPKVGVVVPTLGTRQAYLVECLNAVLDMKDIVVELVIVAPAEIHANLINLIPAAAYKLIPDPGRGLAAAINTGIASFDSDTNFGTWLGDDDLFTPGSLRVSADLLNRDSSIAVVYGDIAFIDDVGREFMKFKSTSWARWLMFLGPNRVPQPGSLMRLSAFQAVGALDESYKWAFDGDLFMRVQRVGKLRYVNVELAKYRWHVNSLSASQSGLSRREASRSRIENLPIGIRPVAKIWEALHIYLAELITPSIDRRQSGFGKH
jgi:glycosyltransferase involved in cell wall biosynthesis